MVIIASTRAAGGVYTDRTGPIIAEWLTERSFDVTGPLVVADGPEVGEMLRDAIGRGLAGDDAAGVGGAGAGGASVDAVGVGGAGAGGASVDAAGVGGAGAGGASVDAAGVDGAGVGAAPFDGSGADLVITSGGTGISPTDRTPQATTELLDYEIPGLAAAIRAEGSDKVPTAVLSRGVVGVAGRTLVVNLPGSTGGVRDGLAVLDRVLDHALDQLRGGDHHRAGGT